MNPLIERIYDARRVQDEAGNEYELESNIDRAGAEFLSGLIADDPTIIRTLEVGCAQGLSALVICCSTSRRRDAKHIIIDPLQHGYWKGVGVANLRRANIGFFELAQEPSEYALPKLAQNQPEAFDMVFIDGWHTFDHTLLDMFYANLLIRVGGYIVVDDCGSPPVSKAIAYMSRYPCYQLHSQATSENLTLKRRLAKQFLTVVPEGIRSHVFPHRAYSRFQRVQYSRMVALRKKGEDDRDWNWYEDF